MPKKITLENGVSATSLAEFNDGNSHFIEDDRCYVLVNRNPKTERFEMSPHLFAEALEVLRKLPIPKPLFTKAVEDRLAEETTRRVTRSRRR